MQNILYRTLFGPAGSIQFIFHKYIARHKAICLSYEDTVAEKHGGNVAKTAIRGTQWRQGHSNKGIR
jgi:hypothetical protein